MKSCKQSIITTPSNEQRLFTFQHYFFFFYLPTIMLNMYFELLTYNVCFMPQLSYFIYHFLLILCYCNNICKICIYCLIICEQLKRVVVGSVMALLRFVKCLDSPNHVDKVIKPVLNLYLNCFFVTKHFTVCCM